MSEVYRWVPLELGMSKETWLEQARRDILRQNSIYDWLAGKQIHEPDNLVVWRQVARHYGVTEEEFDHLLNVLRAELRL